MNARDRLSPALLSDLHTHAPEQSVIVSQHCRQLRHRLASRGIEMEPLPIIDAVSLSTTGRGIALLSARKDVRYIEKNHPVRTMMDVARKTIGLAQSAKQALSGNGCLTGKGVTIAIVDTGLSPHPDFAGRIKVFVDLVNDKEEPYDDNGHGTMCAGCAAGSGAESDGKYCGVAPEAELVVVKAMDEDGGGTLRDVIKALQWLSDNRVRYGIHIASLSLGIEFGNEKDMICQAAEALWTQGMLVVAAAGNSGPKAGTINSPGRAASVLTVGAMDDRGDANHHVPDFSSRGPVKGAQKPDLCAPGVDLVTTERSGYALFTGTSAATPVVAGCAALLLEKHPSWTPDRIKAYLLEHALCLQEENEEAEGRGVVQAECR